MIPSEVKTAQAVNTCKHFNKHMMPKPMVGETICIRYQSQLVGKDGGVNDPPPEWIGCRDGAGASTGWQPPSPLRTTVQTYPLRAAHQWWGLDVLVEGGHRRGWVDVVEEIARAIAVVVLPSAATVREAGLPRSFNEQVRGGARSTTVWRRCTCEERAPTATGTAAARVAHGESTAGGACRLLRACDLPSRAPPRKARLLPDPRRRRRLLSSRSRSTASSGAAAWQTGWRCRDGEPASGCGGGGVAVPR